MSIRRGHIVYVREARVPSVSALLGAVPISSVLLTSTVPADSPLVWPLVVLTLGAMAYDLGARALRQRGE